MLNKQARGCREEKTVIPEIENVVFYKLDQNHHKLFLEHNKKLIVQQCD